MTTNGNDDLIITGTGDDSVFCGDGAMDGTADAGGSNSFFDCELQDLGQSAVCVWKHVNASGFPGPAPFTFALDGPVQKTESTADGKGGGVLFLGLPGGTYTLSACRLSLDSVRALCVLLVALFGTSCVPPSCFNHVFLPRPKFEHFATIDAYSKPSTETLRVHASWGQVPVAGGRNALQGLRLVRTWRIHES